MNIQYNTPQYRSLYKSYVARQKGANILVDIEPRVRGICLDVFAADLGVSIYSCEGHGHDEQPFASYIMFAAKNREDASKLIQIFQVTAGHVIDTFGVELSMGIEHDLAVINDDAGNLHSYPRLIIRGPSEMTELQCDQWWELVTKSIRKQLRNRIELQKFLKASK